MSRKKKQKRIVTIDAETDPFKYGRVPAPFCWGFYDGAIFQSFWGKHCTARIMEYLEDEPENTIIYAHNGGKFDFHFLLPYLDPDLFIINGRISKATLFNGRVELRDSWLILPLPLSAHEKDTIDYKKMESEVRSKHKPEIISYLQTDCKSLHNWVSDFAHHFGDNLTLAGAAFKQLKKTDYYIENTYTEYDEKFRDFYFGGRVQCFEVGAFKEDLEYVDINSAYSFAMVHKHWHGDNIIEQYTLPGKEGGSWFAKIDALSKGALPFRGDDNKLYFPDDDIERTYFASGWEINAGLRTNTLEIKNIHIVYRPVFHADFKQYVAKFFKMKREADEEIKAAKKSGDKVALRKAKTKRQLAKNMLNSCYGKFGQDGRRFEKFAICEFGEVPEEDQYDWEFYADTDFDRRIYSRPDPSERFFNTATAASITGFVRAYLWESINQCERPLYCDTDSIICKKFHGKISNELGDWDLEANIKEAYIAQRKMYALKTTKKGDEQYKIASKGVKLDYKQIKKGVLGGKDIETEKDAPAFSLKYGARFLTRTTNFSNIAANAINNPV